MCYLLCLQSLQLEIQSSHLSGSHESGGSRLPMEVIYASVYKTVSL